MEYVMMEGCVVVLLAGGLSWSGGSAKVCGQQMRSADYKNTLVTPVRIKQLRL